MNGTDALRIIRAYVEQQFPKECSCGRVYRSAAEFIHKTSYTGSPESYDAMDDSWAPQNPLGTVGLSNCACGTTVAISSEGMERDTLWSLMTWARDEADRRGLSPSEMLVELRSKVDESILNDDNSDE